MSDELATTQWGAPGSETFISDVPGGNLYTTDLDLTQPGAVPAESLAFASQLFNNEVLINQASDLAEALHNVHLPGSSGDPDEVLRRQPIVRPGEQMERLAFEDGGGGGTSRGGSLGI